MAPPAGGSAERYGKCRSYVSGRGKMKTVKYAGDQAVMAKRTTTKKCRNCEQGRRKILHEYNLRWIKSNDNITAGWASECYN